MSVTVFNRWGEVMYQRRGYIGAYEKSPNDCIIWDGNRNGKPVPIGVYYYVLDPGDGSAKSTGTVTIER